MAKVIKINENFTLGMSSREADTNDTVLDVDVRFENPKDDALVIQYLNTWLRAIGRTNIVVTAAGTKKGDA